MHALLPMVAPPPQRSLLLVGPGAHFGTQLAQRFVAEGFAIALLARSRRHLDPLSEDIRRVGGVATSAIADVVNATQVRQAIDTTLTGLPPLSCVIFNVKASAPGRALELDPSVLTACLAANVSGAVAVIQAAQPWLRDRRRVVILTGGGYKDKPNSDKLALSVSKAALHSLFRSSAEPLLAAGISLKTIVIDGAVRETGPLFPEDVAACFWAMYTHPTRRVFRYPSCGPANGIKQLGLFRGALTNGVRVGN